MHDATSGARVDSFVRFLRRLRGMARLLLVSRAVLLWVGMALAALVVGGVLDFVLRSPMGVRVAGLAAACGVGAWAAVRFVWPALSFRPSLSELALRVERQPTGRGGEMRGLLASAVELAEAPAADPVSERMRDRVIAEALERWKGLGAWAVLRPSFAARALVLCVAMIVAAGSIVVLEPSLARTGAARMLLPWSGVEWPKRQVAIDATAPGVHAIDEALPMRAAVVKTNRSAGRTPVRVAYRGITETDSGAWRTALLTGQNRRAEGSGGELYERLIDPAEALAFGGDSVREGWIEYRFETDDDRTEVERVRVVSPPEVTGARVSVRPPAYAAGGAARAELASGEGMELGGGDDERALVGRVLSGSFIEMEVRLNKAVPAPEAEPLWERDLRAAAREVLIEHGGDRIRIAAVLEGTVRLAVSATDEFGLSSRDEAVYVLDVIADAAPEPIVREPDHDEQLVATAVVGVSGDARDDLGLARLALEQLVARVPGESEGAAAEPSGEWESLSVVEPAGAGEAAVSGLLDFASLGVRAGDEVWLSVTATDTYAAAGLGRDPVRSRVRRLRVISASDLMAQMQSELGALRQAAMRLDEQQAALSERLGSGEMSRETAGEQRGLTDRIAAQSGTVQRLANRQERNGIEDAGLSGMLRDASAAIASAAAASSAAARAVEAGEQSEGDEAGRAQAEALEQQRRVRDELASLIDQLDRGEDGWVARRSIERLLEEQREVMEQTRAAGERMLGRSGEELSPTEQTELDRIAERQRELARRAAEAIDELGERGRQLREADPAQSAAMAEAERRGREQEVSEQLDRAAEAVEQNQTTNAQSGQQAAMDAMEEMLEDLDNAERQRNAALMRRLASLVESLEGLVGTQEAALERLAEAVHAGADGLDAEMIRLRNNTLAVAAEAGGAELAVIAGLVERAAEAQGLAITALRSAPVEMVVAQRREQESLLRLREALAEARKQQEQAEQAEQDQKRREIRQAYREQLEQQVVLREEAGGLTGEALARRDRARVRGLGQRQGSVRDALADLLKSTQELSDAAVFALAHRRLEQVTGRAAETMGEGRVTSASLRDQDSAVGLLRALVEVLGQNQRAQERDFDEGADGGGSGGASGAGGGGEEQPLLPPITELMLLRSMQAEVALMTRLLDEGGEDTEAVRELGELQRSIADEAQGLIDRLQRPEEAPETPGSEVQQ